MGQYIFSADNRFFDLYHVKIEDARETLSGIPYVFHDDRDDRRTHPVGCPGNWKIKSRLYGSGDYDAVDKTGESRLLKNFSSFHRIFPEPLRYSSWAEYDRAQEKKKMERLEKENEILLQKVHHIQEVMEKISSINNTGGPGSRRAVRELINSNS